MRIVSWSRRERRIAGEEASDFFDRPLAEPWLFHFTTSRLHVDPHAGAFSLKLILKGEECYRFGRRVVRLRPGRLLFVSPGREYESEIAVASESLSLFLPDSMAGAAWAASAEAHDRLIDAPPDAPAPELPAVAWRAGRAAERQLARLRLALADRARDPEEAALALLMSAARSWRRAAPARPAGDPLRAATREELLQRVMRARELIVDLAGVGCRLDLLAETACLSRFHFLRVFSETFGQTPGRYARSVRLARAAQGQRTGEAGGVASRLAGYSRASSLRRAQARSAAL